MERHYTDGTEPTILPHIQCSGPCNQGRIPCPTPGACEVQEPDFYGREHWLDIVQGVVVVAALAGSAILAGVLIAGWLV